MKGGLLIVGQQLCDNETPESSVFKECYHTLQIAIQSPSILASELFSRGVICSEVRDRVQLASQTTTQKNIILLNAVERQIKANPKQFHTFVSIISEETALKDIGFQLNKEYCRQRRIRCLKFIWYIVILAITTLYRWRFFIILAITMLYSWGLAMTLAAGYLAWRHLQWLPSFLTWHSKHSSVEELQVPYLGKDLESSLLKQYHPHSDKTCLIPNVPPKKLSLQFDNYQLLQRVVAVSQSLLNHPEVELKKDEQFCPTVSVLDLNTGRAVDHFIDLHQPGIQGRRNSTCYLSVTVEPDPWYPLPLSDSAQLHVYRLQRKNKHLQRGSICLQFCFPLPDIDYKISFSIHSLIDSNGNVNVLDYSAPGDTCTVRTVDKAQGSSSQHGVAIWKSMPYYKFTGPCKTKSFLRMEMHYKNLVISGNTQKLQAVTSMIMRSNCACDIKIAALINQGFGLASCRISKGKELGWLSLDEAYHMSNTEDCRNSHLFQARILRYYITLCRYEGNYTKAFFYLHEAKSKFADAAPLCDYACVLYEEANILALQSRGNLSPKDKETIEVALTRSAEIARFHSEEFEKTFVALVLARKAMFHLNCLEYFCASGDTPELNSKPSSADLFMAKQCLEAISREVLNEVETSTHKATYYMAWSEYHRWKEEYCEAITFAEMAREHWAKANHHHKVIIMVDNRLKMLRKFDEELHTDTALDDILDQFSD